MILEFENVLSSELCKETIQRFELDDRKKEGVTHGNEVNKNIKRSIDLPFNFLPEWHDIKCKIFDHMHIYIKRCLDEINKKQLIPEEILYCRMLGHIETPWANIQRTDKGEFFDWHVDYNLDEQRLFAFIYYLNTLDEKDGGETEFYDGTKIRPKEGKLIMFPTDIVHFHRGCEVKTEKSKYIVTGFICRKK